MNYFPDPQALKCAGVVALLPSLWLAFYAFNKAVSIERHRFRDEWAADGRPRGWFRPPSEGNFDTTVMCFAKWLLRTPRWDATDGDGLRWISAFRAATLVWNLGNIALVAAATLLTLQP